MQINALKFNNGRTMCFRSIYDIPVVVLSSDVKADQPNGGCYRSRGSPSLSSVFRVSVLQIAWLAVAQLSV